MSQSTQQPKSLNKVLIIEDEGDMCLLLNILLSKDDMELDHVKNLKAAEEYLQSSAPSVVILDNKLPDGLGMDFIPYLKSNYPEIKIIMISGYDNSARDAALACGADVFLEKPFTKNQLYDALKEQLNQPETI